MHPAPALLRCRRLLPAPLAGPPIRGAQDAVRLRLPQYHRLLRDRHLHPAMACLRRRRCD
jgi:hypothetical protein